MITLVFAFDLFGDSLRDVLDPKLRAALTATGMRTERMGLVRLVSARTINGPGDQSRAAILS
jgi:hypothetical protein